MRHPTCFAQTGRLSLSCFLAIGAVMWAVSGAASAQALQAPITLQGTGPFHRITVPIAIYSHTAFDDLRDVRVRNAAGQAVPFGWLGGEQEAMAPRTASMRAPLFAVPVSSPNTSTSTDELVGFKLRADGSLTLTAAPTVAAATAATAAWVIDASKAEGALVQLRVELATGSQGMFPFTLEGSDDMRQWRSLGEDKLLVRLQRADQTIERLAVEIEPVRARFLRLRWRDPALAPMITGVWLDSVHQEIGPASAIEWSAEVRAARCGADYCDYFMPRGLPAESLRIALAESNTLAPVRISALSSGATTRPSSRNALYVLRHGRPPVERQTASTQELALVDTVVYRLTQSGGEARSPNVALDGNAFDTLRLRTNGPIGALGSSPPTLFFGARPRTLVFLTQGSAPFSLSWSPAGRTVVEVGGALSLTQLLPGYQPGKMPATDVATVALNMPVAAVAEAAPAASASTAKSPAASPASAQKWWLWAVLCAGLLLLGGMAWSLFRGFKRGVPPPA